MTKGLLQGMIIQKYGFYANIALFALFPLNCLAGSSLMTAEVAFLSGGKLAYYH